MNNEKDQKLVLMQLLIMQYQEYIYSSSDFHQDFSIRSLVEQIFLLRIRSKFITSFIELLHNISKTSITWFAIYSLHYNQIFRMIKFVYDFFTELLFKLLSSLLKPGIIKSTHDIFFFHISLKLLSLFGDFFYRIIKFNSNHS